MILKKLNNEIIVDEGDLILEDLRSDIYYNGSIFYILSENEKLVIQPDKFESEYLSKLIEEKSERLENGEFKIPYQKIIEE